MNQTRLDIDRPPDLAMQLAELERERDMRRRVYPRRIAAGAMRQEDADHQNACLDAAIETLARHYRATVEP